MTNTQGPIGPDPGDIRPNIPAIETWYSGTLYRSRTEARWKVFFDFLKIEAEYEPEGFVLADGTKYLPDYWIPKIRMWGEVKPTHLSHEEHNKCKLLASGTGFNCLFLVGTPAMRSYEAATWDSNEYTVADYSLDIDWHKRRYYECEHRLFSCPGYAIPTDPQEFTFEYHAAVWTANQFRFEASR